MSNPSFQCDHDGLLLYSIVDLILYSVGNLSNKRTFVRKLYKIGSWNKANSSCNDQINLLS